MTMVRTLIARAWPPLKRILAAFGAFYLAFGLVFYETPMMPVMGVVMLAPYLISRGRRKWRGKNTNASG